MTLREQYPQRYPQPPAFIGKTRSQVKLELAEAIRSGDYIVAGEGLRLRDEYPQSFPVEFAGIGRSRAEVKLEVVEAQRAGELVPAGEGGFSSGGRNASVSTRPRLARRAGNASAGS